MNSQLQQQLVSALTTQYNMAVRGDWLRGTCPDCGKKELFTHAKTPIVLRCGRQNNCGFEGNVRDLVPDLFIDFNKKHPALKDNPNATANAYMELVRGLNPVTLKGNWKQGNYYNPNADKGTATVVFTIAEGITMERFVEEVTITESGGGKDKRGKHFTGKHRGMWWQPAGMKIKKGDTVWIVEGCIDALSLYSNGMKAVASLSSGNYPDKNLQEHSKKEIDWVWALDNDKAGTECIRKHHKRLLDTDQKSRAAIPPKSKTGRKQDWNDLFVNGKLTEKFIKKCAYEGNLLTAERPIEKAKMIWNEDGQTGFEFDFKKRTYWFSFSNEKFAAAIEVLKKEEYPADRIEDKATDIASSLREIANCKTTFLYYQKNEITDESWYYARVDFPHGGAPVKSTFAGSQLSSASEFKKRLLSIAPGAVFLGASFHLDHIIKDKLYALKTVETVDYIGYSPDHSTYVFNQLAIKDGKTYKLNDEDFFPVGKTSIKTLCNSPNLVIGSAEQYNKGWQEHFWTAYAEKGLIALSFWIGSYFAEQIRAGTKSYPFLEVVGQAGSGKSTLIEFLWKLSGRQDYEGFDPSKSTLAARSRNFSQISNLPICLIESEREEEGSKARGFDWDELKTAYNGRASRSRGVKNNGNDTYEPPFRGSIVISQNADVNASEAILSRILHVQIDRSSHTKETKLSADYLNSLKMENVSHFIVDMITRENKILTHFFDHAEEYEKEIMDTDGIRTVRIAKNHGQLMALMDVGIRVLGLGNTQRKAAKQFIIEMALEREKTLCSDHSVVQEFWDIYDYLESNNSTLSMNHATKDGQIAINLNHFIGKASEQKQNAPDLSDLKRHLKSSIKRKFIDVKAVRSGVFNDRTMKCWVFQTEKNL